MAVAERKSALGVFYRQLGQVKARPLPMMVQTEPRVEIIDLYSKAHPLLEEALGLFKKVHGDGHLRVAFAMSDLGICLQLQGKLEESTYLTQVCAWIDIVLYIYLSLRV